jgi:drug/metabolite transporter (DMT)-like permease
MGKIVMPADVLQFGISWPPFDLRRPLSPAAWTVVGALSIPLWATWPTLAVWASSMPAFEVLTVAFVVGWLVLKRLAPRADESVTQPRSLRRRYLPVFACTLGLCGSNAFFILATSRLPAAQANLISYLWPVMVVGSGGLLGIFRLQARHFLGLGLGFAGAATVLGGSITGSWAGAALALLSGAFWAAYCLFRLREGAAANDVLAPACGVSALLCLGLHLSLETTVLPEPRALLAAISVGIAPLALANFAWDQGMRRGDGQLLAVMAYATPLVSALLLILVGIAAASLNLLAGALMIVSAGMMSRGDRR